MDELLELKGNDNNQAITSLNNKYQEMVYNSKKKFLSSILLIGEYSSGKSSLLNSLIGLNIDLLQVKTTECSKVAIIIRYSENINNSSLYSAQYKQNELGFYFEEGELEAKGITNIKKKIYELNEKNEFKYYILYTHIQGFDDLNMRLELKKKIELIDFPGLASDKNNYYIEKEIYKLLKNENAFIFVKNGKEFNVDQSFKTINFVYKIINEKYYFNINNCLFLFTHLQDNDYNMKEVSKSLLQVFEDQTKGQCKIKKKKNKDFINENNLIITKFESPLYNQYIQFKELVDNFTNFFEYLINRSHEENIDFYQFIDGYLTTNDYEKFNEIYEKTTTKKVDDKQDNIGILEKMLKKNKIKLKNNEIKKYVDYYLKIKDNKKLYFPFIKSNYEEMLQQLKKVFNNIEIMLNETLNFQIHNFSIEIFELFNDIENFALNNKLNTNKKEVEEMKEEINNTRDKLNTYYSTLKNKSIQKFDKYEKKLNKINVNDFKYKETKELYLDSVKNITQKYNNKTEKLYSDLNVHIEYISEIILKKK